MIKHQKLFIRIMAIILALVLAGSILVSVISSTSVAKAVTQAEIDALEAERDELEQKRDEMGEKIDDLEAKEAATLEKRDAIMAQVTATQASIDNLNEQIANYEVLIAEKEVEVQEKEIEEAEKWEIYEKRIRSMEENGTISYFSVIFGATSFSDLLSRIDFVAEIMEYDEQVYQDVVEAKEATKKAKEEFEASKAGMEKTKAELEVTKEELIKESEEAAALLDTLKEDIDEYKKFWDEFDKEQDRVVKEIEEKMAEFERQHSSSTGGSYTPGPGAASGFIWPSYETYITSYYGWRIHPIYGYEKFHHGVDIGAAGGTEVWAIADGTVITSAYEEGGYGNYVVVYHGNNTASLYAHMREKWVSVGDVVSQGDVVGLCGTTGGSTGNHIHFEIQVGGSTVDPLSYY